MGKTTQKKKGSANISYYITIVSRRYFLGEILFESGFERED